MSTLRSALYAGAVTHRRLKPRAHALRYSLFWMLLDLDEITPVTRRLRLFSHNRFNLFALHDRDHLDGSATPLRAQIEAFLAAAGLPCDGGPIRLLCVPRILGHAFNPLSVYLCHWRDGRLGAILYEVNNTFGQRHCYLAPADGDGPIRQSAPKRFYVSPFMDMDLTYDFQVAPPGERVSVSVNARDADGPVIATNFSGRRQDLSDVALLRAFATHPLMTLKVVGGIHWEALRLWRKGLRLKPRPAPPGVPVTLGRAEGCACAFGVLDDGVADVAWDGASGPLRGRRDAGVVELVDAPDSKSGSARSVGSIPTARTTPVR